MTNLEDCSRALHSLIEKNLPLREMTVLSFSYQFSFKSVLKLDLDVHALDF